MSGYPPTEEEWGELGSLRPKRLPADVVAFGAEWERVISFPHAVRILEPLDLADQLGWEDPRCYRPSTIISTPGRLEGSASACIDRDDPLAWDEWVPPDYRPIGWKYGVAWDGRLLPPAE